MTTPNHHTSTDTLERTVIAAMVLVLTANPRTEFFTF